DRRDAVALDDDHRRRADVAPGDINPALCQKDDHLRILSGASTQQVMAAAPVSGICGCRHTSTGKDTMTREKSRCSRFSAASGRSWIGGLSGYALASSSRGKAAS